jgi:hypothetical protein
VSYDPSSSPLYSRGRPIKRPPMTEKAAKKEAARLMAEKPPSPELHRIVLALANGGVLTEAQIMEHCQVKDRVICTYVQRHFLNKVPLREDVRTRLTNVFGKSRHVVKVCTLGVLGRAIAPYLTDAHIPSGYIDVKVDRVTHDVFCNEVALRLIRAAERRGFAVKWRNKYSCTVKEAKKVGYDRHNKQDIYEWVPILEPDALLELRKDGYLWPFLIEYHNEDYKARAETKVDLYERICEKQKWEWSRAWGFDWFPTVLCVFTHRAPGYGYLAAMLKRQGAGAQANQPEIHWHGKRLAQLLRQEDPFANWIDLISRQSVRMIGGRYG